MGRLDKATLLKSEKKGLATVRMYAESGMAYIVKPRVGRGQRVERVSRDEEDNQRIAAHRNRRNLILLARKNRPTHFVTLTFSKPTEPREAVSAWHELAGRWRKRFRGFYVRVGEVSDEKNLHFHVLCSQDVAEYLQVYWLHGFVDSRRVHFSDLASICSYMAKDFGNSNRPFQRRYVASKGAKPKFEELLYDTMNDALDGVAEMSQDARSALDVSLTQTAFGEFGEVTWHPTIGSQ
jgi:hypothetical protein